MNKNSKISGWIKWVQDHVKDLLKRLSKWWRSGAVVVCLVVVAAAVCWWSQQEEGLWAWMGNGSDEKISNSEMLRNLALIGGLFIGIPLALWRNFVATRQVETSERNLRNERYQTGANMLGSDTLATRLGGIYALEHLAKDHPDEYHINIMKLLCAFARHPRTDESFDIEDAIRPDVDAAMQAIRARGEDGKKLESDEKWHLNLRGANLKGASLIDTDLTGAKLKDVNLTDANMYRANLTDADMSNANLTDAGMSGAKLTGANMFYTNLTDADMSNANLTDARIFRANLTDADISHANLTGARISRANLTGADMSHANLTGARMSRANLTDADISHANLTGAYMLRATLTDADMSDVDISDARLNQVEGLTQESLNMARALKDSPPIIPESTCAKTDEPLTWTGGAGEPLTWIGDAGETLMWTDDLDEPRT